MIALARSISLRKALADAKREHTGKVTSLGFEHRELGPHVINTLYYSVHHVADEEIEFIEYRTATYCDGNKRGGMSF